METLSYGFQKPEDGDKGPVVFPALEANIQQLNDHSHNGEDSALLDRKAVASVIATLSSADWVDQGGGMYRQLVAMPAGMTYDTVSIMAHLASGHLFYPNIEKSDATHFYIYINDNTQNVRLLYG